MISIQSGYLSTRHKQIYKSFPNEPGSFYRSYYPQGIFDSIITYDESYPSLPFNSLVAFYYQYKFKKGNNSKKHYVLPDGCVDLKFYCNRQKPKIYICGTTKSGRLTNLACDGHEWFGIRFRPGNFFRLLPINAEEFTENEVDITYLKCFELGNLPERILDAKSFNNRIFLIENYFNENCKKFHSIPSWIKTVVSYVISSNEKMTADELYSDTNISHRHFRRVFKKYVGVSPKCLSRIARFQNALKEMQANSNKTIVNIALEHGYYDQAHFTHEFKEFYGRSPSKIIPPPIKRDKLQAGMAAA